MSTKTFAGVVRTVLALLVAAGVATGCDVQSFDDAVVDIPGSPPPPAAPPPAGFGPDFSAIQANVFTPDCATSNCHSGANPPADLNLEDGNSYVMLVDIESSQDANVDRVEPGQPDDSYLIQKLEGVASTGQVMPPGAPLPRTEIDVIRQWITDGSFDDGNEVSIRATSIAVGANSKSAVIDLANVTLPADSYRITLKGTGPSFVMDLDANALDGDFIADFEVASGQSSR